MNARCLWLVACGLAALAGTATAAPAHFEPLAFLAGHCWRGSFPDGKSTDTHCYEWALGGAHLRDTHAVCGEGDPYLGETFYSWDPEAEKVSFRYFNSLGGVSEGHLELGPDGIRSPEERYVDERGEQVLRSTLMPVDAVHYSARTEQQVGGRWVDAWTVDFKRVDGSHPDCPLPMG